MPECIFCKIAAGELPAYKIYEDDDFLVILDRFPTTRGHALIITKAHATDIFGLSREVLARAGPLAEQIGARLVQRLNCEGLNILQNNGTAAGQTVHHFHLHLIPRFTGDDVPLLLNPKQVPDEDMEATLRQITRDAP